MPRRPFVSLVLAAATLTTVPVARAAVPHALGRHCGIGWSDGYHSRAACPQPKIAHQLPFSAPVAPFSAPVPAEVPWWKIPAADAEVLPTPAGRSPATTRTAPVTGPSLFGQPSASPAPVVSTGSATAVSR
jgi:hypothetical protein